MATCPVPILDMAAVEFVADRPSAGGMKWLPSKLTMPGRFLAAML